MSDGGIMHHCIMARMALGNLDTRLGVFRPTEGATRAGLIMVDQHRPNIAIVKRIRFHHCYKYCS